MNKQQLYECADFFMARTSVLPQELGTWLEDTPKDFIEKSQQQGVFLEGIALASPKLYQSFQKLIKNLKPCDTQQKKVYLGLLKYFIRMTSRATPFGAFSFVRDGQFAEKEALDFDFKSIRKKVRLDMEWLYCLIDFYHSHADFVKHLKIMANPLIMSKGSRFYVEILNRKTNKQETVSIRKTIVTEKIFAFSKNPILYTDLEQLLCTEFPNEDPRKVFKSLWQVFEKDFFLSELTVSLDHPFSMENLIKVVEKASSSLPTDNPDTSLEFLHQLLEDFKAYQESPLGNGFSFLDSILEKSTSLKNVEYPIQVDTYYNQSQALLNQNIQPLLEETATLMHLLQNHSAQSSHLKKYHEKFLNKYGFSRLVPILELVNPTKGLGFPAIDHNEPPKIHKGLKRLLAEHQFKKSREIIIDDLVHTQLKLSPEMIQKAPLSIDLFFELIIDSETFTLVMNPNICSHQAGCTFGRFLYLWDSVKKERLKEFLSKEESVLSNAAIVEASYHPMKPRLANVAFYERVRKHQLLLHYRKDNNSLELDDLYVGAREDQLYLYSKTLRKEIKICSSTSLNPQLAPPVLKLLLDISTEPFDFFSPYLLDPLRTSPFLPRIRYKNVILSPARWFFDYDFLQLQKDASSEQIEQALHQVFENFDVPDNAFLTDFDNRLLLNLRSKCHFKILVDHLIAKKEIVLFECLTARSPSPVQSEQGSHVTEFVVPLVKRNPFTSKKEPDKIPSLPQIAPQLRTKLPISSDWLFAKIYLSIESENDFIISHLSLFASQLLENRLIDQWFYIRYQEELPHIRVRFHGDPEILRTQVLNHFCLWCLQLFEAQFIHDYSFHTYDREIERYGGVESIDWAEKCFCADSLYCAYLLDIVEKKAIDLPKECIAAFGILNMVKAFFPTASEMLHFLSPTNSQLDVLGGMRTQLKKMERWTSCLIDNKEDSDSPLFNRMQQRMRDASEAFLQFNQHLMLSNPEKFYRHQIYHSLIHMHCNRFLGIDQKLERKARVIAYFVLNKYSTKPTIKEKPCLVQIS